jgi:hypothetical protein
MLRAFNVKIASIKDSSRLVAVRAAACGGQLPFKDNDAFGGDFLSLAMRLRMHCWRDAISRMYKGRSVTADDGNGGHLASLARRNPTLRSLVDAAQMHGLMHQFLRMIVEALEADLDVVQYGRVRDVAQYGKDTMLNVLYLTLECLGVSICGRKNIASLP